MQAHRQWVLEWMRRRLEGLRACLGAWVSAESRDGHSGARWGQSQDNIAVNFFVLLQSLHFIWNCSYLDKVKEIMLRAHDAWDTQVRHNFTQLTQAGGVAQSLLTALWCRLVLLGSCESFWTAGAACKQFELLLCYCLWFWSFYYETYFKSKVNVLIQFVE